MLSVPLFSISSVLILWNREKILKEGGKKRLLPVYGNFDLVEMYNLGSGKYCIVFWSNLGVHTLKSKRC
jgi:hypothetical protein